ncbi:MAG: hypothetical protein ACJ8R9_29825 [Steroidobacteraceae bacterium]
MWRKVLSGAFVVAVFGLLAGCGGNSSTTSGGQTSGTGGSQTGSGGTTATIQGIATPASVSVVTATNSN